MVLLIIIGGIALIAQFIYYREAQQKAREKHLIELDQQKNSFFTNVSHELNTPLTTIMVPLRRLYKNEDDAKKKAMLGLMLRNTERMSVLVSQLLEIRTLEEGKSMQVNLVEGDVVRFARETLELLKPMAENDGIVYIIDGPESATGYYDADKLMKILQNLAGNAIKYTTAGGRVRSSLTVAQTDSKRLLTITIEDTGCGIPEKHREQIFDRFYRIPESSLIDGAGIGLQLTHEIVQHLGGTISVESPIHNDCQNPGTRFIVILPLDHPIT